MFLEKDYFQGGRCVGHRIGTHHFPFLPKSESHRWTLRIQYFCYRMDFFSRSLFHSFQLIFPVSPKKSAKCEFRGQDKGMSKKYDLEEKGMKSSKRNDFHCSLFLPFRHLCVRENMRLIRSVLTPNRPKGFQCRDLFPKNSKRWRSTDGLNSALYFCNSIISP